MKPSKCSPGYGCFTCPYEDCILPTGRRDQVTKEETRMSKAGRPETVGKGEPNKTAITHYVYHRNWGFFINGY